MTHGITPPQRAALDVLARVVDDSTYLAGGVALALRFGHRQSRDLDLFDPGDPTLHADAFADAALGVRIVTRTPGTLHLEVGGVPTSWLRYSYPLLAKPERIAGIAIPLASLDDAMCMKLSAIAGRGAARDFWDLHEILSRVGVSLDAALDAFRRKYATEDTGHVLKALAYFADAEAAPMPLGLERDHWTRIKHDFERWVLSL